MRGYPLAFSALVVHFLCTWLDGIRKDVAKAAIHHAFMLKVKYLGCTAPIYPKFHASRVRPLDLRMGRIVREFLFTAVQMARTYSCNRRLDLGCHLGNVFTSSQPTCLFYQKQGLFFLWLPVSFCSGQKPLGTMDLGS